MDEAVRGIEDDRQDTQPPSVLPSVTACPSAAAVGSESKRRKLRKGTHSCWECKRRKIRCNFAKASDSTCVACRKHRIRCVSQHDPEETAERSSYLADDARLMGERIVRVEDLVKRLAERIGTISDESTTETSPHAKSNASVAGDAAVRGTSASASEGDHRTWPPLAAAASSSQEQQPSAVSGGNNSYSTPDWEQGAFAPTRDPDIDIAMAARAAGCHLSLESIASALHAALPQHEDIMLMVQAGIHVSFHNIMMQPYAVIAQHQAGDREILLRRPSATTHPTVIAKYMLIIATCLQFAHPQIHAKFIARLSEPPAELARRLVTLASRLVTNNDDLLDSVEALQCIMMESIFEANAGHLRRAWFVCRRAMLVAQLMGFHRNSRRKPPNAIDPTQLIYPNVLWTRIVSTDRQLCLMLGLPQGSLDVSMASEVNLRGETPEGRFERKQAVIASFILERNESSSVDDIGNLAALQAIDADLQKAADELPSKWWLVPNLAGLVHDSDELFWATIRLLDQVFYFNLRNMLHLPYMLRSHTPAAIKYDYSKVACTNASRELLTRFIMFRSFNPVAFTCRSLDFFAITASLTLAIAHLDAHRRRREHPNGGSNMVSLDILAHQRQSDRAMIEQTMENMETVASLNGDILTERGASLLRDLLSFERAAAGSSSADNTPSMAASATPGLLAVPTNTPSETRLFLQVDIPYFGAVQVSRDGLIAIDDEIARDDTPPPLQSWLVSDSELAPQPQPYTTAPMDMTQTLPQPPVLAGVGPLRVLGPSHHVQDAQGSEPHMHSVIRDTLEDQYQYPSLTAGIEDWTFQGIDMTFFDNLMRHADEQPSNH